MLRSKGLFTNRQRSVKKQFSFRVSALVAIQLSEAIETPCYVWVLQPERLFSNHQRSLKQRFSLSVTALAGFWCKVLKGSVSRDNRRDDGTDFGTGTFQGPSF